MKAADLLNVLRDLGNPEIAEHSQRFFKTGKGEYGEGDTFLGIRVPVLRQQAKAFHDLPLKSTQSVLRSRFHEARLCALFILVRKFEKGDADEKEKIYNLYLENTKFIDNWDLVDSSAHQIVGGYLFSRDREFLDELAVSDDLWERRISIIATLHFIREHQFEDTYRLADILLQDPEDLIHKAVGWMIREAGNRNGEMERAFLKRRYKKMPRTMLRYAIEKFPEAERKAYLAGAI